MSRNRIPTADQFAVLSFADQGAVLCCYLDEIEEEISGLKSGWIRPDHRGRGYHLKLARARLKRLTKLANDFGYWLNEDEAA